MPRFVVGVLQDGLLLLLPLGVEVGREDEGCDDNEDDELDQVVHHGVVDPRRGQQWRWHG